MPERLEEVKNLGRHNVFKEANFRERRRVRQTLYITDKLNVEMLCYLPGQGTPEHIHPVQDEVFYTVKGSGTITVEGEENVCEEGDMIYVFQGQKHAFQNHSDDKWILMFFKAPGTGRLSLKEQSKNE